MRSFYFFIALITAMVLPNPKAHSQTPVGYELAWSDEFNGTAIDPTNWGYDIGGSGWGNNELQYYTNRTDNARVENGNLVIEAKQEAFGGKNYTSARLLTKGKREFTFGRIDIRAKLPFGQGIWPALWTLGANIDQVSWPACGEMDIMELLGHEPNKSYGTVHWGVQGSGVSTHISRNYTLPSGDFSQDFHLFSLIWETDVIKIYVDNNLISTVTRSDVSGDYPFNKAFFLIFNVAVGGNWPGSPNASTVFPQRMLVDYVRVYRAVNTPSVSAPTPQRTAANVKSLFSNAYTNLPVTTWSASWDNADVADFSIGADNLKKYTNLLFAGIEFPIINASAMTHLHMDIWTPDASSFKIKLVDFGPNGIYNGGGDDREHELTYNTTTNPAIANGQWISLDIPLSNFSTLTTRTSLAQLLISTHSNTVFVDNVYFYTAVVPIELASFKAFEGQNRAFLHWTTATEKNNKGFFVEASADAKTWRNLGFVAGNGTTTEPKTYQFWDDNPASGSNYYRLRQVDADGGAQLSAVCTVVFDHNARKITLFPNPTKNVVSVMVGDISLTKLEYAFYDLTGLVVKQGFFDKNAENTVQTIDISDLPKGNYVVKFSNHRFIQTEKLVIN
jgi:beta-glucanase (GH16 family)